MVKGFFSKKQFPDGHTETLKFKRDTPLQIYKLLESEGLKYLLKKLIFTGFGLGIFSIPK